MTFSLHVGYFSVGKLQCEREVVSVKLQLDETLTPVPIELIFTQSTVL